MRKEELKYIQDKIAARQFSTLSDEISSGMVYKIHYKGDLEEDGYEIGYLVMEENSEIKEHEHTENIEKYKCLMGTLNVNGEKMNKNICYINCKHNIDKVPEKTIIKTIKISKKLLIELLGKQKTLSK